MKVMCIGLISADSTGAAEGSIKVMSYDQERTAKDSRNNFPGVSRQQEVRVSACGDAHNSDRQEK